MNIRQALKHRARRELVKRGISVGVAPRMESLDQHIRGLIDKYEIGLVLDIGANRGDYGRRLRRNVGYNGHIVSFEPDATPFAVLAASAAGDPRWHVVSDALGRDPRTATLNVYPGHDDFNSLHALGSFGKENYPLGEPQKLDIQVKRLDDFADRLPVADSVMIKTDTQGHDLEVLAGGPALLRRCQVLQVEVPLTHIYEDSPTLTTYLEFISAEGFLVSGMFSAARGPHGELVELDLLAIRPRGTG